MNIDGAHKETQADAAISEQASIEELRIQHELIVNDPSITILAAMPTIVFVLNLARQIVWMNAATLKELGEIQGLSLRPGEAFGCIHAREAPGGCGATMLCGFCGAPKAFQISLHNADGLEEWVIQRDARFNYEALDLLVWTHKLSIGSKPFILFSAHNQSQTKRQDMLERIFYHDISNTVSGIHSLIKLMEMSDEDPHAQYMKLIDSATEHLIDEIESQRALRGAEKNELSTHVSRVSLDQVMTACMNLFTYTLYGKDILIQKEGGGQDIYIDTDAALLRRVLINMLKNALEASSRGATIRMGCQATANGVELWVWNAAALDPESMIRMFQRSYTTKGTGRGYGTYSMKLLTERYLGGAIDYESSAENGTRFVVKLPISNPKKTAETP